MRIKVESKVWMRLFRNALTIYKTYKTTKKVAKFIRTDANCV